MTSSHEKGSDYTGNHISNTYTWLVIYPDKFEQFEYINYEIYGQYEPQCMREVLLQCVAMIQSVVINCLLQFQFVL